MIGIYMFKNLINGKIYIGQSINIKYRQYRHFSNTKNNKNSPLYNDLRLYGIENFEFDILEECSIEDLNSKETFYIKKYNSLYPNGYNIHAGGSTRQRVTDKLHQKEAEVISLIENTDMLFSDIAKKFGVSNSLISEINLGHRYFCPEKEYPLRKIKNRLDKDGINTIIKLLKEDKLTLKEIAKLLNVSPQAISNINVGSTNYSKDLVYPIRKSSIGRMKTIGKEKNI